MTDAELIDRLIEEAAQAPDWRSGFTLAGHLPVFNNWGPAMYLTRAGEVVMNDEAGGPLRPAGPAERDFGLARAAEFYPELSHLRPARPGTAVTCDRCDGRGRLWTMRERIESRAFVYCPECNGIGWTSVD